VPRQKPVPRGRTFELGQYEFGTGKRRVRVHVPGGVPEKHPALFLFDGQNAFDDEGSFAGGWHAHRAADRLGAKKTIPAPVVVAIDHGGAERIRELAPFPRGETKPALDELLEVIQHRVMPDVHARLSLREGPEGHVIGGSSMGGLAALYAHFRRPEVFAGALVMSPSLWFGTGAIFDFVAGQGDPYRSRVYLDCGGQEGGGRMLALTERMAAHLRGRGWLERKGPRGDMGRFLMFRADARGRHDERAWRRRLPKALQFLF